MAEVPGVVSALSSIVARDSEVNSDFLLRRRLPPHHPTSVFDSPPGALLLSVPRYLRRIFQGANCSPACYVVAYIYLDRFLRRHHPAVVLLPGNVHMFLLLSVLAAIKFIDREACYCGNPKFAMLGLIDVEELNELEIKFLFGMGFDMNVTPELFEKYCLILHSELSWASPLPHCPPPLLNLLHRRCSLMEQDSSTDV